MIANSRAFNILINGIETAAFVPFADMLNHKRPKHTKWSYCDEQQGLVIKALDDIPRGDQVYVNYGNKCNSRIFLNYGFVSDQNNDANEVPLIASIDEEDPLFGEKVEMLNGYKETKLFMISVDLETETMK